MGFTSILGVRGKPGARVRNRDKAGLGKGRAWEHVSLGWGYERDHKMVLSERSLPGI